MKPFSLIYILVYIHKAGTTVSPPVYLGLHSKWILSYISLPISICKLTEHAHPADAFLPPECPPVRSGWSWARHPLHLLQIHRDILGTSLSPFQPSILMNKNISCFFLSIGKIHLPQKNSIKKEEKAIFVADYYALFIFLIVKKKNSVMIIIQNIELDSIYLPEILSYFGTCSSRRKRGGGSLLVTSSVSPSSRLSRRWNRSGRVSSRGGGTVKVKGQDHLIMNQ